MFVRGDYPEEYHPYGKTKKINDDVLTPSILMGKSISFNGDSIMYGYGSSGGFGKIIADRNEMTYENISVTGSTICYQSGRNCISRKMETMTASDYMIFEGGINDKALNVPFGSITSDYTSELDDTTFCGAFEKCCKTLVEKYTTSKCGYVFVHKIATAEDWDEMYRPAMFEILNKWGIPYIDLQTLVPPLNFIDNLKNEYTSNGDGWHPNEKGYRLFYVDKIESWLKTL